MSRKSLTYVVAIWAALTGVLILVLCRTPAAFDSPSFQHPDAMQDGRRLEMADDLIARSLLDNKTRTEVIALLGEPLETGYFSAWDLVYLLGPERGFIRIDDEWLVVRFDDTDKVVEYRIVRD